MHQPIRAFSALTAPRAFRARRGQALPSGPTSLRAPLAVLVAAQFLVMFSASNINIVLPAIGEAMHLSPVDLSWIVTVYVLAVAALLLPAGAAMDITGRRRLLLIGLAVLGGASALAGLAGGAATLITARVLQGVGVALVEPAVLCLLLTLAPGPRRNKALGALGAGAALGGGAGVLLGGLLTEAMGWRGIFYATAFLALLLALVCVLVVPADAGNCRSLSRRDLKAATLMLVGLLALSYGMTEAARSGWTRPVVLVPLGVGVVLLTTLAAAEKRRARPLLPLRMVTTGDVGPANIGMGVLGTVVTGMFFFLSLYQQQILGDGPRTAALCQVPLSVAMVLASTQASRLARRAGSRTTLGVGLAALGAGLLWLGRAPGEGTFVEEAMAPSVLIGAGLGIAFVQLTQAATAGVPHQDWGAASGLVTTTRMIGGVFGLALLTSLAASRTAGADPLAPEVQALHEGYRATFTVLGLLVLATALFLLAVVVRPRAAPK
ncbi:MFS transporter [Streptomyces sp. NPDC059165]|uniref:MFS transporter n=1 Tax=Streptomyces sp. NPDC059165 TaxID=3346751 RepID=UPI0036B8BD10